jgi:hypothetical protein
MKSPVPSTGLFFVRAAQEQAAQSKKPDLAIGLLPEFLGWLMGLEPTTTGITILDSTN